MQKNKLVQLERLFNLFFIIPSKTNESIINLSKKKYKIILSMIANDQFNHNHKNNFLVKARYAEALITSVISAWYDGSLNARFYVGRRFSPRNSVQFSSLKSYV